jgi:hypothetical protein
MASSRAPFITKRECLRADFAHVTLLVAFSYSSSSRSVPRPAEFQKSDP